MQFLVQILQTFSDFLLGAMTFRIMTFCITIFMLNNKTKMTQHKKSQHNDTQHDCRVLLCWVSFMLSVRSWVFQRGLLCWVSLCWMSLCWVSWHHLLKEPWTRLTWRVDHSNPEFGIFFFQFHLLNVTPQFIANVFWTENIFKLNEHVICLQTHTYTHLAIYMHV